MSLRVDEMRFLVAEDDDFQRRAIVRMLMGLGAKYVAEASDGKAALDQVRGGDQPVDIIISDLDMPGMDGMELIRHIGDASVPVSMILSSAVDRAVLASVETMTKAYGIVLLGAIEKPVSPKKLQALIDRHRPIEIKPAARPAAAPSFPLERIQEGLERNEFVPFFQPKVELRSGRVKGAEALARWRHPELGIVSPFAFIKALEDGGGIDTLTWQMLSASAAACAAWVAAGLELTVSVNLSLKSLTELGMADHVTQLVRDQGLAPRYMVIEVTETAAMTEVGRALESLARLRMKGFGLSIDDYGTGYSSMQQLSRIAFTELKIDQSFVASAVTEEASRVILQSSLEMARRLKLVSVAEGVEGRAHWTLLKEFGCDLVQGYFVAKPMPGEEFIAWAQRWTPPD